MSAGRTDQFWLKAEVHTVDANVLFIKNLQEYKVLLLECAQVILYNVKTSKVPVFDVRLRAGIVFSVLFVVLFYPSKPI